MSIPRGEATDENDFFFSILPGSRVEARFVSTDKAALIFGVSPPLARQPPLAGFLFVPSCSVLGRQTPPVGWRG
jgi:hypothetical protein